MPFKLPASGYKGIKSIQRGELEISGTTANVAVTAVDMNKSFLTSSWRANAATSGQASPDVTLTTTTNINATRVSTSNSTFISWELVEFF